MQPEFPTILDQVGFIEAQYMELCESQTGNVLPLDQWEKLKKRKDQIQSDSKRIVDMLFQAGIDMSSTERVCKIGLMSGKIEMLPGYKQNKFIPCVAGQKRAKMVRHLEYWLSRNRHDRYWVITCGERVKLSELRASLRWLHRKVSKLNAQHFMKDNGVEIVFRASEFTIKMEDGEPTFHPHANCVIHMNRRLPKAQWRALLSRARSFIGHHFEDSGAIFNFREICKYMTKPADLKKLTPDELGTLFVETKRLRMVAAMSGFRAQLSSFKDSKLKLLRKVNDDGKTNWAVVSDWNAHAKKTEAEELIEEANKLKESARNPNQILARLAPGPHFGRVCEPAVVVRVFDGDASSIMRHPLIAPVAAFCRDNWEAGQCVLAAEEREAHLGSQITHNSPQYFQQKSLGAERTGPPLVGNGAKPPPKY